MIRNSRPLTVVIAAGGTGGHLYPAVALAHKFLQDNPATTVLFVGTTRGIEAKVLAHEGLKVEMITALPFMGAGLGRALRALLALPQGIWQSVHILRKHRADLVIGVGGYTSPPVLLAAFLLRIPRVIVEPNAHPGMANKALGPLVDRVFLAFGSASTAFAKAKVRVVGVPVREEFLGTDLEAQTGAGGDSYLLLVFGGSQGARAINEAMIQALPSLGHLRNRLKVVHQTGQSDQDWVQAAYDHAGYTAEVGSYFFDMPRRLRAATLVVSRSGAMTLAELTVCGKPAVLIPLPHAIYDHQMRNAEVLASAGAAVLLSQAELTGERLAEVIDSLMAHPERLQLMSERSRALGRTDSALTIVRECMALAG